jgi:transcriptional regulator with XRE-family HTH domain
MSAAPNRLRDLRRARGLAQAGLGVQARVSPTIIASIENWNYKPSEAVRERLAEALGVAPEEIWPTSRERVA